MTLATVQTSALQVAAAAIVGRVAPRDIAVLRGLAAEALPEQDPLRIAIEDFARRHAAASDRHLLVLGKRLGAAVAASRNPGG